MDEEILEIDDIQGNSIAGFNKQHMTLLSLRVQDAERARSWLRTLSPQLTTARSAIGSKLMFRQLRAAGLRALFPAGPAVLNAAVSAPFLRSLGFHPERLSDEPFVAGLEARSASLGDPKAGPGAPASWVIGNTQRPIDLLLIVGSEDATAVSDRVSELRRAAEASGFQTTGIDEGSVRSDERGHEHFGFNDGISQPAIRGRNSATPGDFFEPRTIAPNDPSNSEIGLPEFASPGKPLIWPGQFLFGYRVQDGTTQRGSSSPIDAPSWARNGSLIVYRRLRQDVGAFRIFLDKAASQLGIPSSIVGSKLIGRWSSGASPVMYPNGDPGSAIGNDSEQNNSFQYINSYGPVTLKNGDVIPQSPGDVFGDRCPLVAHLRKVNPRDGLTEEASSARTLTHRILRRGIPFGPSYEVGPRDAERGLLFVAYQTSIAQQFEFLVTNWMNREDRPAGDGFDLVVGQNPGAVRTRSASIPIDGKISPIIALSDFIMPTGGAYLFSPSISFFSNLP